MSLAPAVRDVIRSEEPRMPIPATRPLVQVVDDSLSERRFPPMLVSGVSLFSLFVSGLGVCGVVAYSVSQRRDRFGIRMALGARGTSVVWNVVWQGMAPVGVGLAVAVTLSLAFSRVAEGMLYEVRATDPLTIAGGCALMVVVGIVACVVPACRAVSGN